MIELARRGLEPPVLLAARPEPAAGGSQMCSSAFGLRDIVVEKQREQEGIIAPSAVRVAAAAALSRLLDDCEADLSGRSLAKKHVHDTITRLRRMSDWSRRPAPGVRTDERTARSYPSTWQSSADKSLVRSRPRRQMPRDWAIRSGQPGLGW